MPIFPNPENNPRLVFKLAEIHSKYQQLLKQYKFVYTPENFQLILPALEKQSIPEIIYKLRKVFSPEGMKKLKEHPNVDPNKRVRLIILYTYLSTRYIYNRRRVYQMPLDYEFLHDYNNDNVYMTALKKVYDINKTESHGLYNYCNRLKKDIVILPLSGDSLPFKYDTKQVFAYYKRPLCKLIYNINVMNKDEEIKHEYITFLKGYNDITKRFIETYEIVKSQSNPETDVETVMDEGDTDVETVIDDEEVFDDDVVSGLLALQNPPPNNDVVSGLLTLQNQMPPNQVPPNTTTCPFCKVPVLNDSYIIKMHHQWHKQYDPAYVSVQVDPHTRIYYCTKCRCKSALASPRDVVYHYRSVH